MKNRYYITFLIFSFTIFLESARFFKSVKATPLTMNSIDQFISSKQIKDSSKARENNDRLNQSFYRNGYTYEESLKTKNQIFDLFGFSFKNKNKILGFPEQRIESDAFLFWKAYQILLEDQINKNKKITQDLDNGFNTSLYK